MNAERKIKFIIDTVFAALVTALCLLALKYLIWWLLPLILGFAISLALRPVVNLMYRLSSATRKFCAAMVLLLAYAALFALLWLGILQLVALLRRMFDLLPVFYEESAAPALARFSGWLLDWLDRLFPNLGESFSSLSEILGEQTQSLIGTLSTKLAAGITGFVRRIPTMMITFLFTVLSSFFISLDYNNVSSFFARLVPRRHRKTLFEVKDFIVRTVLRYGRAYLTLLAITFAEVWAGLALLRVRGSGWWALAIALMDLLPAIGTGLIMIPWGAAALLQGNRFLGIGLLALYGVVTVVRSLIEPKIVGDNIGLPPLATITAMFFGLKLLGLWGMFIAPMIALILKFLCDSGKIRLWDSKQKP